MAQGLPVISFGVGGVPEQISDRETGLLVPPFEMGNFARFSAALLGDPTRCRDMGRNAFFFGKKRFSVERMVADYGRLYARLS